MEGEKKKPKYRIGKVVKVKAMPGLESGVKWAVIKYIHQDENGVWYKLDGLDFERREEDLTPAINGL